MYLFIYVSKDRCDVCFLQDGSTPLHAAAWKGWSRCVAALSHGRNAQLSLANKKGFSPLHLACQNGHNQSCRELLLAGAEPDVRNLVRPSLPTEPIPYLFSGTIQFSFP